MDINTHTHTHRGRYVTVVFGLVHAPAAAGGAENEEVDPDCQIFYDHNKRRSRMDEERQHGRTGGIIGRMLDAPLSPSGAYDTLVLSWKRIVKRWSLRQLSGFKNR